MTGGPLTDPLSAYPTLRTPASICFTGPSDVFRDGVGVGLSLRVNLLDGACIEPMIERSAAAMVMTAAPRKRRRSLSTSSDMCLSRRSGGRVARLSSSNRDSRDATAILLHDGIKRPDARLQSARRREELEPARQWFPGDHPKVNEKTSTAGSRNSIANCRSTIGRCCRIS